MRGLVLLALCAAVAAQETAPYEREIAADGPLAFWTGREDGSNELRSRHDLGGRAFTVEFWTPGVRGALLSYGEELKLSHGEHFVVRLFGSDHDTGVALPAGETHHVAIRWRSRDGRLDLCVDGVPRWAASAGRGRELPAARVVCLGAGFEGSFGSLAWHDVVLPLARLRSHYLVGAGLRPPTPPEDAFPVEFRTQIGPEGAIRSVACDPDGRLALSGGLKSMRLWDLESGRVLRYFGGYAGAVYGVALSGDARLGLSAHEDEAVRVWDVATGGLVRKLEGHTGPVWCVAFSPDDRHALSAGLDGTLRLWDVLSGRELKALRGHAGWVTSVAFGPGGGRALSGGVDHTVRLWDLETGEELRRYEGHDGRVWSVAFSPDGRYVIAGGCTPRRKGNARACATSEAFDPVLSALSGTDVGAAGAVRIWEAGSGKPVADWIAHGNVVLSVACSANGRVLLTTGKDKLARLWDLRRGEVISTLKGHGAHVTCGLVLPGARALTAGMDSTLRVWDARTGEPLKTMKLAPPRMRDVAVTADGRYVLGARESQPPVLWDLSMLRPVRVFAPALKQGVIRMVLAPDGRYAVTGGFNGEMLVWDVATGRVHRRIGNDDTHNVTALDITRDGRLFVSGSADGKEGVRVWNVETGGLVRRIGTARVSTVALSPDGRFVAAAESFGGGVHLYELETGEEVGSAAGDSVRTLAFGPAGRLLAAGTFKGEVIVWDLAGGGSRILEKKAHTEWIESVLFSPSPRYLFSVGRDAVRIWDLEAKKVIRELTRPGDGCWSLALSPDGVRAYGASLDGAIRMIDTSSGRTLSLRGTGAEWIVHTDDGYFDASPRGASLVAAVMGTRVFGVDQLALTHNRPDVILERFDLGSEELRAHYRARHVRRLERAGLDPARAGQRVALPRARVSDRTLEGHRLTLDLDLRDVTGLRAYQIYVNDVPLFTGLGRRVAGTRARVRETIELTGGTNKVEVSAVSTGGLESLRALEKFEVPGNEPGDLYYLGFGVSHYRDRSLDLGYAAKDARDLAQAFEEAGKRGGFRRVFVRTCLDADVTVQNIRAAREFAARARPEDTLVLFIAGHGMHERTEEARYYFLTHDADPRDLARTAASFELIEDLLSGIAPRRKLFLMDTCESGELEDSAARPPADAGGAGRARAVGVTPSRTEAKRPPPRPWLLQRDRFIYVDLARRSGAIVFSSCRGGELSYESAEIENGFFTEELLAALRTGAADADGDGEVTTDELRAYVSAAVPRRTNGFQHPVVDRDNIYQRFAFPAGPR